MRIFVNGDETEVTDGLTVAELVADRGLNPNMIVVEHNLTILSREDWPNLVLTEGDKLEIVTFMGGG